MDIGFIGFSHMGFPMARRLLDAGHTVMAFDTRSAAVDRLVAFGATPAASPEAVARLWETALNAEGADSDFTAAIKPLERAAGVTVGGSEVRE